MGIIFFFNFVLKKKKKNRLQHHFHFFFFFTDFLLFLTCIRYGVKQKIFPIVYFLTIYFLGEAGGQG